MGADWLNIAGGAAKGYVQGDEDNRRREEFNTLQRQRLRVEKKQKEEDELDAELAQVKPAGKYKDEDTSPQAGTVGPPSVADTAGRPKVETTVTAADADRAKADIIARKGGFNRLDVAARLRQGAFQTEEAQRREDTAKKFEVLGQVETLLANGNHVGAHRQFMDGYNKYHKDGYNMVEEMKDGVLHSGVVDKQGNYVQPLTPVTPESMKKLVSTGYSVLTPEMRAAERKHGLDEKTVGIQERAVDVAAQNAATALAKANYEIDKLGPAQIQLMQDQGYAARTRAEADKAAGQQGKIAQVIQGTDSTGKAVYMAIDNRGTPIRMDFGDFTPAKLPQQLTDVQREAMKAEIADHKALVDAGKFASPIQQQHAFQAILSRYGGGGGDGVIGTLQKNGPRPVQQFGPQAAASNVAPSTAGILGINPASVPAAAPAAAAPAAAAPAAIEYNPKGSPPAGYVAPTSGTPREQKKAAAAQVQELTSKATAEKVKSFDSDAKDMKPVELVRKYDKMRGSLSPAQLVVLQKAQQKI